MGCQLVMLQHSEGRAMVHVAAVTSSMEESHASPAKALHRTSIVESSPKRLARPRVYSPHTKNIRVLIALRL